MSAVAFDTLAYARRLRDAGVPESQADAQAVALAEALKSGIADLATKADLETLRTAFKADLDILRTSTKADLQSVKADLQTEIEKMGRLVIMWNVATLLAAVGVVFAIARYLAP